MSFRLRVTVLAAVAVAIAIIGTGALMYSAMQRQLFEELDRSLAQAAASARLEAAPRIASRFPFRVSGPNALSPRSDVLAQVIDESGRVVRADPIPAPQLVTSNARAIAAGGPGTSFDNVTLQGPDGELRVRALTVPFANGTALIVARSLQEIDSALADARRTLLIVAAAGILLAGLVGALVSRAALDPVARLSKTVAEVTRTGDLSRRVAITSNDELGRLATSFDAMLIALESSLRSQRQLVADASHELRTPLTSLRTNLELLARGQPTDEADRAEMLRDLVGQIERLTTLVSDLIDLARDEHAPLTIEDVRLDMVAAEAIEDVRGRYREVSFVVEAEPSTVRGVRARIARAVTNLLDNAAKWSPAGGVIEVRVAEGEVAVRDHGPGIAPSDRSRVFDRFWRAANAKHLPGSGLGLAIVRDVAHAHDGDVLLEHPSDGGARFRLRLPVSV